MADIEVFVNGKKLNTDSMFCVDNKTLMVDVIPLVKALGGTLEWIQSRKGVTVHKDNKSLCFVSNKSRVLVSGKEIKLKVEPRNIQSTFFVPAEFLTKHLGGTFRFYRELNIAAIETNLENVIVNLYVSDENRTAQLDLEEYVAGVVCAQVPYKFHTEAIKAQAVAARTYVVKKMLIRGGLGCDRHHGVDVCSDINHCQEWISKAKLKEKWGDEFETGWNRVFKAVKYTSGLIMTYNAKPIEAVSHPVCGGCTENSENVWGNKISYLRKVTCNYCRNSPYWKREKTYTLKELEEKLKVNLRKTDFGQGKPIPEILEEVKRTSGDRVKHVRVGDKYFDGNEIRQLLNFSSSKLGWQVNSITFYIMGYGHGLGMCRYGANEMAARGLGYEKILPFYYTGIKIEPMVKTTRDKPLFGKTIAIDPAYGSGKTRENQQLSTANQLNLELGKILKKKLMAEGAKAVMVREGDSTNSLHEKVRIANDVKADLFVGFNLNPSVNSSQGGIETFYFAGDSLSEKLAIAVHPELAEHLGAVDRGIYKANFYVLRETDMPSIMIEMGVELYQEREKIGAARDFLNKAAEAIIRGVKKYYR
jgi:stage II sporulation protein D